MELTTHIAPLSPGGKRFTLTVAIHLTSEERRQLPALKAAPHSILHHLLLPQRFNNGVALYVADLIGQQRTLTFSNETVAESVEDMIRRNGTVLCAAPPPQQPVATSVSRAA